MKTIDIFNDDGTLNEHGGRYAGMDRFAVREQIERDLASAGLLEKVEAYTNNVGYSERTSVAIEPKLSMQWFLKMDRAGPAGICKAVMDDDGAAGSGSKFKNVVPATGWRTCKRLVHLAASCGGASRSRPTILPDRGVRGRRNARSKR